MTTETIKVKIPTYKTIIEYQGKELVLKFRELKRNEKLKLQVDIERFIEVYKKESKTPEDEAFIKKMLDDGENRCLELLESIEGEVVINDQKITLEAIRAGDLPDSFYTAIKAAYTKLTSELASVKAEAEEKKDQPQG